MNPNWSPPQGFHEKLGRLDQIRISLGEHTTRLDPEWVPWNGGRMAHDRADVPDRVPPDHPFAPQANLNSFFQRAGFPPSRLDRRLHVVLGDIRWRGHLPMHGVCFSTCGRWLATFHLHTTFDEQLQIMIWETASGELVQHFTILNSLPLALVGMTGPWLVVANAHQLVLYNWQTPAQPAFHIACTSQSWSCTAKLSPDGRWVVAVGTGATLIDIEQRRIAWTYSRQSDSADFVPDGRHVLIGNHTSYATLHDLRTGAIVRQFPYRGMVGLDPTGQLAFSRRSSLTVWDFTTTHLIAEFLESSDKYRHLRLAAEGLMFSLHRKALTIWNATTGAEAHRILVPEATAVALSPTGRLLAVAEYSGVRLFSVRTGSEWLKDANPSSSAAVVAFSPDATLLVGAKRGWVSLWRVADGALLWQVPSVQKTLEPMAAAISSQNSMVAIGYHGSKLQLFHVNAGRRSMGMSTPDPLVSLQFDESESTLRFVTDDLNRYEWPFGRAVRPAQGDWTIPQPPRRVGIGTESVDGRFEAIANDMATVIYA